MMRFLPSRRPAADPIHCFEADETTVQWAYPPIISPGYLFFPGQILFQLHN